MIESAECCKEVGVADDMENGVAIAVTKAGSRYKLAQIVGVNPSAVLRWTRVPIEHVSLIEGKLEIPRSVLRPDIYPPDRERIPL